MELILCEKAKQAAQIAAVLQGPTSQGRGYIKTQRYMVTWASGHLLETAEPAYYDPRYRKWQLEDLPIIPLKMVLLPIPQKMEQVETVCGLIKQANTVYIATDAGREGELIAYELLNHAGYTGKLLRLWFKSLDRAALVEALKHPLPASETVRLYYAARVRQLADWLFGMNLSRAATKRLAPHDVLFAYGRVMTPTLALITKRDEAIETFKTRTYFDIHANVVCGAHRVIMQFSPRDEERRIYKEGDAKFMIDQIINAQGAVRVTYEKKVLPPPKPFALNDLQVTANRRFGMSAQNTLEVAQALYEAELISYPRTNSRYLPEEQIESVPAILENLAQHGFIRHIDAPVIRHKTVFNTSKLTDHHAIIPTPKAPEGMTDDQRAIYTLIAVRYAIQFLPDYEYQATVMQMEVNGLPLTAHGHQPIKMGWRGLEQDDEDGQDAVKSKILPPIPDGAAGVVEGAKYEEKQTEPPERYTDGTLIRDMEAVGKFVDDPRYRKVLKDSAGIGQESTRAAIIEKLKEYKYIVVEEGKKKKLVSTAVGRLLVHSLPPLLVDPMLTAVWEVYMERIINGTAPQEIVEEKFKEQIAIFVRDVIACIPLDPLQFGVQPPPPKEGAPADQECPPCPKCGSSTSWRTARKTGQGFFGCTQYPKCKGTVNAQGVGQPKASQPNDGMSAPDGPPPACPACHGSMFWRINRSKQTGFWGCAKYPACKGVVNVDVPKKSVKDSAYEDLERSAPPCPECGKRMKPKIFRSRTFYGCVDYPACHGQVQIAVPPPMETLDQPAGVPFKSNRPN